MDITYITATLAFPLGAAGLHWMHAARRTRGAVQAERAREREEAEATLGERLVKIEAAAAAQLAAIMVRLDRIEEKIDAL